MADRWLFKSETYDNCNCAMNCGCQFNLPSTHGYCQSAFVGNIVEGHFNDTPLAGLNWAALYKWPGEIKDGKGRRQIVIDERAEAQSPACFAGLPPSFRRATGTRRGARVKRLSLTKEAGMGILDYFDRLYRRRDSEACYSRR